MRPLVSVLMPCYNCAGSLPMAMASLKAQTYGNWECVLVNDGSTDHPERIVTAAEEPRIRYIALPRNMGRGYARQVTLDEARGAFVTMLDADDWLYPERLERQVRALTDHPQIDVLGMGMAVVDRKNELKGIRMGQKCGNGFPLSGQWHTLRMPPMAFAPLMIRTRVARQHRFNKSLGLGEDADYLLRLLFGRCYAMLPEVFYAYSEHTSVTIDKVSAAFRVQREMFMGYVKEFPLASRVNVLKGYGKAAAYRIVSWAGLWDWAIAQRSAEPTFEERKAFHEARETVLAVAARTFGFVPATERVCA